MALIKVTTSVQIEGGPQQSFNRAIAIEAYDRIEAIVPAATPAPDLADPPIPGAATVQVQPGVAAQVQFLLMTASQYSDQLTYSLTGGVTDVDLDAPQIFLGPGAVELLKVAPQSLNFSNSSSDPVTVVILVGRDATPPPP